MKLHERESKVRKGSLELQMAIHKVAEEYELTQIEVLQALNSFEQSALKYMLRVERHGDEDTPAGLAREG